VTLNLEENLDVIFQSGRRRSRPSVPHMAKFYFVYFVFLILQCFDTDGVVTVMSSSKSSATSDSKSSLLSTGLNWSNLTWSNSVKMVWLNKN